MALIAQNPWTGDDPNVFKQWLSLWNNPSSTVASSGKPPVNPTLNVPTNDPGKPVAYVLGRTLVSDPCVISYGNITPITQTDSTVKTTTSTVYEPNNSGGLVPNTPYELTQTVTVDTTYIIGYNMDIQLGICLGPNVKLVGIYYNNTKVWSGSIGPDRSTITLPSGLDAISGAQLIFHGGAFDQVRDPIYSDPDIPGYVGIAYAIIRNVRADLPLQPIAFEVERISNPLGLTTDQNVIDNSVNAVSAITDVITNDWGGAGINISNINTVNFSSKALIVDAENNASAITENGGMSFKSLLNLLLNQIMGIIYQNPSTGKLELSLIRKNFSFVLDNNLTSSDIVNIRGFDKTGWNNTLDKLAGNYTDRSLDYTPNTVYAQNPSVEKKSKPGERNYAYVTNAQLCIDLLARDLKVSSSPLFSISIEANRKAADLVPGSVATVSWPKYKLYGVPVVVQKIKDMPTEQNTVIVDALQQVMPDIATVFEIPGEPFNPNVSFDPVKPDTLYMVTAPFWIASKRGIVSAATNQNIIGAVVMPVPKDNIQATFAAYSKLIPNGVSANNQKYITSGLYATFGELSVAMDKYDGWTTGKLSTVAITNVVNPINLINIGASGIKQGKLLAFLDGEIISFESVTNTGVGEYTLNNVQRGLLDTVAKSHVVGSDILIIGNDYSNVIGTGFNYPLSSGQSFTIVSNTAAKDGNIDNSDETATFASPWPAANARTLSPLRPTDTKINGVRNSTAIDVYLGGDITVSWKNRSRVGSEILAQTDATETPEASSQTGYVYEDIILGGVSVWQSDKTNATPTSKTVTLPTTGIPLGAQTLYMQSSLDFLFGTLTSVFKDELPVNVLPNGLLISEDGLSYLISEDGNSILVQEGA